MTATKKRAPKGASTTPSRDSQGEASPLDQAVETVAQGEKLLLTSEEVERALENIPEATPKGDLAELLEPILVSLAHHNAFSREDWLAKIKNRYGLSVRLLRAEVAKHRQQRILFKGTVEVEGGEYTAYTLTGKVSISSFIVEPKTIITIDNQTLLAGDIVSPRQRIKDFCFPATAWHSKREFLRCLPSCELHWTGSDDQVQGLLRLLTEEGDVVRKQGTRMVGYLETADGPRWVLPAEVISAQGSETESNVVYVGGPASSLITRRLRYRDVGPEAARSLAAAALPLLLALNDQPMILTILGWFFAAPFKEIIIKELGAFPILLVWGTKGAGKTTVVKLFWRLAGVDASKPFSVTNTIFPLLAALATTPSIPVFMDEYKPRDMGHKQVDQIHRLLRRVYDGDLESKGNRDQTVNEYPLMAPVVVAGESRPEGDPALLERMLCVSPNRQTLKSTKSYQQACTKLRSLPLEDLALGFVKFALGRDTKSDFAAASAEAAKVVESTENGDAVPIRNRNNIAVMVFGIRMFEAYAQSLGVALPELDVSRAVAEVSPR